MLSNTTRPIFLHWDLGIGKLLFGDAVVQRFEEAAAAVSVELTGFVARPLYVCMNFRQDDQKHGFCMAVAYMSKLVQQEQVRFHYRCNNCAALSAPASGSAAMRMLHLYPTVTTEHGPIPMKCKELAQPEAESDATWCRWGLCCDRPDEGLGILG